MTSPQTPVAKSLHTVTVIEQVARALGSASDPELAVACAMDALGLAGRPDPYGLAQRALINLKKG